MRIPQKLPQFKKNHALIVVSGKQGAKIFHARNNAIVELEKFQIEKPHYSDLEGFSTYGGRKDMQGSVSGSEHEIRDPEILNPYLKKLRNEIKKILLNHRIKEIYLFVPKNLARIVPRALTKNAQRLIHKEIKGNYLKSDPIDLLRKITI